MVSNLEQLTSGVPQGGILSPLLYIVYVADLQLWLKYGRDIIMSNKVRTYLPYSVRLYGVGILLCLVYSIHACIK